MCPESHRWEAGQPKLYPGQSFPLQSGLFSPHLFLMFCVRNQTLWQLPGWSSSIMTTQVLFNSVVLEITFGKLRLFSVIPIHIFSLFFTLSYFHTPTVIPTYCLTLLLPNFHIFTLSQLHICSHIFRYFILFYFLIFYCYSITVVCLFSQSLHPTPAETTSFPNLHPTP